MSGATPPLVGSLIATGSLPPPGTILSLSPAASSGGTSLILTPPAPPDHVRQAVKIRVIVGNVFREIEVSSRKQERLETLQLEAENLWFTSRPGITRADVTDVDFNFQLGLVYYTEGGVRKQDIVIGRREGDHPQLARKLNEYRDFVRRDVYKSSALNTPEPSPMKGNGKGSVNGKKFPTPPTLTTFAGSIPTGTPVGTTPPEIAAAKLKNQSLAKRYALAEGLHHRGAEMLRVKPADPKWDKCRDEWSKLDPYAISKALEKISSTGVNTASVTRAAKQLKDELIADGKDEEYAHAIAGLVFNALPPAEARVAYASFSAKEHKAAMRDGLEDMFLRAVLEIEKQEDRHLADDFIQTFFVTWIEEQRDATVQSELKDGLKAAGNTVRRDLYNLGKDATGNPRTIAGATLTEMHTAARNLLRLP